MKRFLLIIIAILFMPSSYAMAELRLISTETIAAGAGVKSILIHPDGNKAYAVNLEGMSVHEFDRASRKLIRKLIFIPHRGEGYNYKKGEAIQSYKEKPVEAHFTHKGRYMWVSLHNAGGIIAWDLSGKSPHPEGIAKGMEAKVRTYRGGIRNSTITLPFFETGQTPKVITSSPDGKYLFVANWHSNTVSVLDISSEHPKDWKNLRDIKATIPRGLLVNPASDTLYIAEMGDEHIIEIALPSFKRLRRMRVGLNPRHMILDGQTLYVSINLDSKLAALNLSDGTVKHVPACDKPRTIAMHRESRIIFSVCYRGEQLEAYTADGLELIDTWPSESHPVGVDVYSLDATHMEAWVANYSSGNLNIFSFAYTPEAAPLAEAGKQH